MPENPKDILEQKRRELELELDSWARSLNLIKPGDKLVFSMTIELGLVAQGETSHYSERLPPKPEFHLGPEDWEELCKLPFSGKAKEVVDWLAKRNNGPMPVELFNRIRDDVSSHQLTRDVNGLARKTLGLSLRRFQRTVSRRKSENFYAFKRGY